VSLHLQVPSHSEGDGLASELTRPLSLSDANTARVASRPSYPNPVQRVGRRCRHRGRIPPIMGALDRTMSICHSDVTTGPDPPFKGFDWAT